MGWGMLPSCSCYVDATLMGGVGWGGACYRHVHVTLMLRMRPLGYMCKYIYIDVYVHICIVAVYIYIY